MKAKSHNEDSAILKRIARPIVIGACVGAISCLLVLLVMAAVMAAQNIPKAAVTPMAIVSAAFGSFIGGIVSAKISGEKGLLYGAGAGLLLYVVVIIAGFAVLQDVRGTTILVKLAVMVASGAVGGIIGVNLKRRR